MVCGRDEERPKGLNKKFILLTAFLLVSVLAIMYIFTVTDPYEEPVEGKYGFTGLGTGSDPFLISDLDDLCRFRDLVNSGIRFDGYYFLQTADIDMADAGNWTPIGVFHSDNLFHGSYNGNGHTLSNLTIVNEQNSALFGELCGEVRNLGIESGYIEGAYIGSIASHGVVTAAILNCYNKATVHGHGRAGGIADNFKGRISYCWNFGEIISDIDVVGGISSYNAQISNCYSYQIPAYPDSFSGAAEEVRQFTSSDEIDPWLNQIYTMLYEDKLNRDAGGESAGQLCLMVRDGGTVLFDSAFSQEYFTKENIKGFLADHVAILLLAIAALALSIIAVRRPAASGFILTAFLVCAGLWLLNETLTLKRSDGVVQMMDFYLQPDDTIDVLLVGSSLAGWNQDCEELWTDFGISGYALWGNAQPAWNGYYFLNEALKYSVPKVVVYDIGSAVRHNEEYSDEARQYANIGGIKLSLDKFSAVQASAPQNQWLELLTGFPVYHTRYSELTQSDFKRALRNDPAGIISKGSSVRYTSANLPSLGEAVVTEAIRPIAEKQEKFLLKIIDKCKAEDIPLLLIVSTVTAKEIMQYHNYIAELAAQHEVPFIDFNLLDAEMGVTIGNFYDSRHLNTNGARKQSAYLGRYLKENYGLIDHRGDPRYSSWDEFAAKSQNSYIPMITNLGDYLRELVRDDKAVAVIKYGSVNKSSLEKLQQSAAGAGFNMDFLSQSGTGCWAVEHPGNSSENTYRALEQNIDIQLSDDTLSIAPLSDEAVTCAGEVVLEKLESGITCVVYDTNTKEVVHVRKIL